MLLSSAVGAGTPFERLRKAFWSMSISKSMFKPRRWPMKVGGSTRSDDTAGLEFGRTFAAEGEDEGWMSRTDGGNADKVVL